MILLAILMFCLSFYIIATQVRTYKRSKHIQGARRVLLVKDRLHERFCLNIAPKFTRFRRMRTERVTYYVLSYCSFSYCR